MNDNPAPSGIRLPLQHTKRGIAKRPLRIVLVVCPGKYYFARTYKGTDIVNMLIRLIMPDAAWQPDDFSGSKVLLQGLFNLILKHQRIASGA